MWSQRSEVIFLKDQDDRFSVCWPKCGLEHPFMSRRLSRVLHQKYFLFFLVCAKQSLLVTIIGASIYHNYIFSCFFCLFFFSLVVVFFSLDNALRPVPEKCTGSEGLRRFAPCEGCSQGVVLGRNWFNRSPYYISFLLARRCKRPL